MQGKIKWKSPSNLAIIKYWGKFGTQFPRNPSISFTLNNAHSITSIEFSPASNDSPIIDFYFEGDKNEAFGSRVKKYLDSILDQVPWMANLDLKIESENSFPHSSGIASSASGMSALALCFCSIGKAADSRLNDPAYFFQFASHLARLGSGSASRSVYPYMAQWGKYNKLSTSADKYAIPYHEKIDPVFKKFHDDILIVSRKEKSVSSTAGHALMEGNIYAENRYTQANQRMDLLLEALHNGDVDTFGKIAEDEALTLHALMMCSEPSYILMQPESLVIIDKVRSFRKETNLPVYFSLDAGPNIHLLYPDEFKTEINDFIVNQLQAHCVDGLIIKDQVGTGPELLGAL